jgi:hypothetical protein
VQRNYSAFSISARFIFVSFFTYKNDRMPVKMFLVFISAVIFLSVKIKPKNSDVSFIIKKSFQDSLPPLHTIKESDITSIESSFENQTITVTFKDRKVFIYDRSDWDYENYYPSTIEKIKKAITDITMTFTKCETPPAFAGGDESWNSYIRNFATNHAKEVRKAGSGNVELRFIVHIHGQITDINVESNTGNSKLSELAKEALKNSPAWICAKQNGHDVIAYGTKIVTFDF